MHGQQRETDRAQGKRVAHLQTPGTELMIERLLPCVWGQQRDTDRVAHLRADVLRAVEVRVVRGVDGAHVSGVFTGWLEHKRVA